MSVRNHPSFKYLIQRCFPLNFGQYTFVKKVQLGHFQNKQKWKLKLEIEECGYEDESSDNMIFTIRCIREDDIYIIDSNIILEEDWVVPYDYEYIMKNIDEKMSSFLKQLHETIQCLHCGLYISNDHIFDNKCFNCGIQNLYDSENSRFCCSICMESIGFGNVKKCKYNHYMHCYCFIKYNTETNKDICPMRCGSNVE